MLPRPGRCVSHPAVRKSDGLFPVPERLSGTFELDVLKLIPGLVEKVPSVVDEIYINPIASTSLLAGESRMNNAASFLMVR